MTETPEAAPSITRSTVIGASWMVAWRMATRGLGLASTLILARLLLPADFGLVAVATAFAAAIDALSELGLQQALVRRAEPGRELLDTAFTMQAIRGIATGVIIIAGAATTSDWFSEVRLMPILYVLAVVAVAAGFDNIAVVKFQRTLRFDMEFRLLLVPRLLQFVLTVAGALILRDYRALILGIAAGRVARTIMTYWIEPYRPRLELSQWRQLAGFSFWSWASSIAYLVWNRCDAFVLGPALGMAQLGIFLLSAEIGLLPTTELVEPATRALYAGVAKAQNHGTDPIALAPSLMAALLMLVLPIGVGISATSGYVVAALLGPHWAIGRSVIAILSLLCGLTPITFVAATVLSASGQIRRSFWAVAGAASLRVAAVYTVAGTRRLDWVALAILAVVAAESALFLVQLRVRARLFWRESCFGMFRTLSACGAVAIMLRLGGLGWHAVTLSSPRALLIGGTIGLGCIASCISLQLAFWIAAGRPQGPEPILIRIGQDMTTGLRRRIRLA